MAPDRARPGGIALAAADHMDMQLRHHIAQIADIELFHARQGADQVRTVSRSRPSAGPGLRGIRSHISIAPGRRGTSRPH